MKVAANQKTAAVRAARHRKMAGISIVEVLIVLVIIAVLTAISLPYVYYSKKLFKPEDQALKVMDLMREASQLALTKRRTFRLEIDRTDNRILLIDGKAAGTADDTLLKSIPIETEREVRMDVIPTGVSKPNPPNYNDAAFVTDTIGHKRGSTTVTGHTVWQISFQSDGSAVNTATGTTFSANLYFWEPKVPGTPSNTEPKSKETVRAITFFGGSGAIRYWKSIKQTDGTFKFVPY